jgi:hypothetical protein
MPPLLDSDETIFLTFDIAFNPSLLMLNRKKAYLTNKRLIIETKPETPIPFFSIKDLKLSPFQNTGKIIELDYGQKTKLNVIYWGGSNNEKTITLFDWLNGVKGKKKMPDEIVEKIKKDSKDFVKSYSIFGMKTDFSKPYTWLSIIVLIIGTVFGGAIGVGMALIIVIYISKIWSRENYPVYKKWLYTIATIILGFVVYIILAVVLVVLFKLLFNRI